MGENRIGGNMSVISDFLKQILTAYYGKDVRQSIHDAIKQCYDDATGNPESVAAVVEQNDKMKELLENTPYTTVESEGEYDLPVHTINDSETSAWSAWSSEKIIDTLSGYKKNSEDYKKLYKKMVEIINENVL